MRFNIKTALLPISTALSLFLFDGVESTNLNVKEVKFARIGYDYHFYVKIGGIVRKIKFVVICFAFF